MTSRIIDKFDRVDGDIGPNYLIACGGVQITDEAVVPIDADEVVSGLSPIIGVGVTAQKTQVFYSQEPMDGPDYVVRTTFAHDELDPEDEPVNTAPSFTLLARMSKDPLLFDLGVDEDPLCYDQGYGARFTFPLDGTAPILKIIKFSPNKRLPNLSRPVSTEVDGAIVLASVTVDFDDFNLDPDFDPTNYVAGTTVLPYRGFWQDARLRIRRQDNEVILEVYLNDRNLNQPKLTHTDTVDPLWGVIGLPGFEFLSATFTMQPSGSSPFGLSGLSLLRCGIFQCETFLDVRRPVSISPGSHYTYRRVTNRVITLVEKDGDAKYNASTNATTKFETYLEFVLEAEKEIIRKEGYFEWLRREQRIYLIAGQINYEFPLDLGLLEQIRPGNWNNVPLGELEPMLFRQRLAGVSNTSGRPTVYTAGPTGPNSGPTFDIFPVPAEGSINTAGADAASDPFLIVDYYAKPLYPDAPDVQIPFVPQEDIDVLIYGAAAHALTLDTDEGNASRMGAIFVAKLQGLRRKNNRNLSHQTILRSAADVMQPNTRTRIPLLRSTQLENLVL